MLPFGYAARATRTVSCGTGLIACALSDIGALLMALLLLLCLPFLSCLFLYRHVPGDSPAVSKSWKNQMIGLFVPKDWPPGEIRAKRLSQADLPPLRT